MVMCCTTRIGKGKSDEPYVFVIANAPGEAAVDENDEFVLPRRRRHSLDEVADVPLDPSFVLAEDVGVNPDPHGRLPEAP